jgi:hypothetical protein
MKSANSLALIMRHVIFHQLIPKFYLSFFSQRWICKYWKLFGNIVVDVDVTNRQVVLEKMGIMWGSTAGIYELRELIQVI